MKRVVDGRLYDTSEAVAVCSWRETDSLFDLRLEAQFTLYREKVAAGKPLEGLKLESWGGVSDWDVKKDASKGGFFLAVQLDGIDHGPGRIRPLGVEEARRLFEEHTDSDWYVEDDYEKYFGVRPQQPLLEQLKEAFKAGAEAKKRQYEEEAKNRSEGAVQ